MGNSGSGARGSRSEGGPNASTNGFKSVNSDLHPKAVLPSEPGRPVVKLAKSKSKSLEDASDVTDEITLKWKPPSRRGNVKIQGYLVEMWDLGLNEWVRILGTDDPGETESTLSNILSGMLYRFRVSAVTEAGLSLPSLPSDAFIINIPGVNIAPYWVCTPGHKFAYRLHDTLHFRLEALGTPAPNFHWYKDEEQIFLADGIALNHSNTSTELIVENLQPEDAGIIKCTAVNTIGRIDWETQIRLFSPPEFDTGSLRRKYRFKTEERIRIKIPIIALPQPELRVYRSEDAPQKECLSYAGVSLGLTKEALIFKIDSAEAEHSGNWVLEASNEHGESRVELSIRIDSVPHRPSRPRIRLGPTDVRLSWDHEQRKGEAFRYLIEYYRDQWALWLNAKYSDDNEDVLVSDLIPGSYYKFRVKAVSATGMSEPSDVSESVMIRGDVEDCDADNLDDLEDEEPYFSRSNSRRFNIKTESFRRKAKFASLSELSAHRSSVPLGNENGERQASLEREVYYDRDTRKEVVTYYRPSIHERYKMTQEESERYKRSMTDLASKILQVSSHSLHQPPRSSNQSLAPRSSKDDITDEFSRSPRTTHRFSLPNPPDPEPPVPPPRRSKVKKTRQKSAVEKRIERRNAHRSLSELRGRISSLQNLLFARRARTPEKELSSATSLHSLSFFLDTEEKARPAPKVISVQNMTGLLETHFLVDSDESLHRKEEEYEEDEEREEIESTFHESESRGLTLTEDGTLVPSTSHGITSRTLLAPNDAETDLSYSSLDLD